MAVSVCCVALSTFPVTKLWPVGIRVQRTKFCCLPCPSCTEPSPSSCGGYLPTATDLATRLQTWAGKAEPESRMTGQQPSKRPGPSMKARQRIKWLQQCSHATTRPASPICWQDRRRCLSWQRTGHSRLNHQLFTSSELVHQNSVHQSSNVIREHLLQACPPHTSVGLVLADGEGAFQQPGQPAAFVPRRGVSIWVTGKRKLQVIIRANWTWSMHVTTSCLSTQHSNNAQALHSRFYLWANANIT